MKNFLIISFCFFGLHCQAQTFNEFFRQKKTQKEYLLKQITALEFYHGFLREGFNIVDSGLNAINTFKEAESSLHAGYFNSLKAINPVIAKNPMIAEIVGWKNQTINLLSNLKISSVLGDAQLIYIQRVKANLISECQKDFNFFRLVITPSKLELTDEQRLNQLHKIHQSMRDKHDFVLSFVRDVELLESQKRNQLQQLKASKNRFNIK
ncbi:MAG TPA: hypothetical protein VL125_04805 [Pelobium sp.]|nr:hypothetical protein [Pelobium sp.]